MRSIAVLLVLLCSHAAVADRERPVERRPSPPPCKCIKREPPLSYQHQTLSVPPFARLVMARARSYDHGIRSCLRQARASSAVLELAFARDATSPRVTSSGSAGFAACLGRITWHTFDAPPRATSVRIRVSDEV